MRGKFFMSRRKIFFDVKKKRIVVWNFTRVFGNKVYILFAPGSKKRATTTIPYIYIKEGRFRCGHPNVMPEGTRKKPRVFVPGLREKFFCLGDADNAWGAKVLFFAVSLRFGTVENGERILEKKWRKKKFSGRKIRQHVQSSKGSGIVVFFCRFDAYFLSRAENFPSWRSREKNCLTRIPSMSLKSVFEGFFFRLRYWWNEEFFWEDWWNNWYVGEEKKKNIF